MSKYVFFSLFSKKMEAKTEGYVQSDGFKKLRVSDDGILNVACLSRFKPFFLCWSFEKLLAAEECVARTVEATADDITSCYKGCFRVPRNVLFFSYITTYGNAAR